MNPWISDVVERYKSPVACVADFESVRITARMNLSRRQFIWLDADWIATTSPSNADPTCPTDALKAKGLLNTPPRQISGRGMA